MEDGYRTQPGSKHTAQSDYLCSRNLINLFLFAQGTDGEAGPQGPPGRMGDDVRTPQSQGVLQNVYLYVFNYVLSL